MHIWHVLFEFQLQKLKLDYKGKIWMSKMTIGTQYNTYYEIYGYYFNSDLSSIATVFAKNLGMNLSS